MNRDKELYRQLRDLSWHELWTNEVPCFNSATARERLERVAVIRAVAVVFSESGPPAELQTVKDWLRKLLDDPCEKVRRYAIAALPKLGRDQRDERDLLALTQRSASAREKQHLARALGKIGSEETLRHAHSLPAATVQRIQASVLRAENASAIKFGAVMRHISGIEIHLRSRAGLERFVREEAETLVKATGKFQLRETKRGQVTLIPIAPFSLADLYSMRCFWTMSIAVGKARGRSLEPLADLAASPAVLGFLRTLTDGPIRYRVDFVGKGHQRASVRDLAQRIYSKRPELLNGGGDTPWTFEIHSEAHGNRLELSPKLTPDPRFAYRKRDVPAASHPPLAACLARLAGRVEGDVIWDPFCGSGLELIERSLLGGVTKLFGTDRSDEAIEISRQNFNAAKIPGVEANFVGSDFRKFNPGKLTLIITNPPLGKRVPIPNLHQLIEDVFRSATRLLTPGGRLVLINPLDTSIPIYPLRLVFSELVDLGGFRRRLEKYTLDHPSR